MVNNKKINLHKKINSLKDLTEYELNVIKLTFFIPFFIVIIIFILYPCIENLI